MSYAIVGCLYIALLAGVSASVEKQRIVGGKDADIRDHPYQVSLRFLSKHYCGGTILDERHILTAAHCVDGIVVPRLLRFVTVNTGSSLSKGKSGKAYKVKKAVIHENWIDDEQRAYRNDIAIVTLTEDIAFDEKTKAAKLPTEAAEFGDEAVVTGWGIDRFPSDVAVTVLQKADMTVIPSQKCRKVLPAPIGPGHVCAYQRQGVGACSGDSGGPLASGDTVVGVASFVVPCGIGAPDVYSYVYHYKDWIQKHIDE